MFVVFALTDWLDGYLARKLNQTSSFGAFLDPVADKFLVCASLLVLVHLKRADVFVALIIIGREIAISALREWMAQIGASKSVAVHMLGKVKTTVQMIAIPFLLFDGMLFGLIDTGAVGHMADLDLGDPHGLVDGLLPAEGPAGNPQAGEIDAHEPRSRQDAWCAAMPAVFVLIWSTGFIVARYGMPHAPPMKFLAVRYVLSVALLRRLGAGGARCAGRPSARRSAHLAVTGILMHAGYLGGVWAAVKLGMGAGLVGAAGGPAAGADGGLGVVARRRGVARASGPAWRWASAGLVLVVWQKLGRAARSTALNFLLALWRLAQHHRRHAVPEALRRALRRAHRQPGPAVRRPSWSRCRWRCWRPKPCTGTASSAGAMAWSVLALTLGGSSLLYLLIQRGAATAVTSLLYLVPPCTAVMAWLLFGEADHRCRPSRASRSRPWA